MKNYKNLLSPLLTLIGIFLAWKIYTWYKAASSAGGKIADEIKESVQVIGLNNSLNSNNVTGIRTAAVLGISEEIYNAFYKADWFGWSENEQDAIDAFNALLSVSEAKACAGVYKANYNKSLYADLKKYCNAVIGTARFADLKTSYVNAIKLL